MAKCDRLLTSGISREKEIVRLTTPKKDVKQYGMENKLVANRNIFPTDD